LRDDCEPCRESMERHTEAYFSERERQGIPVRYSHRMGEEQWEYLDWLAQETQVHSETNQQIKGTTIRQGICA